MVVVWCGGVGWGCGDGVVRKWRTSWFLVWYDVVCCVVWCMIGSIAAWWYGRRGGEVEFKRRRLRRKSSGLV